MSSENDTNGVPANVLFPNDVLQPIGAKFNVKEFHFGSDELKGTDTDYVKFVINGITHQIIRIKD